MGISSFIFNFLVEMVKKRCNLENEIIVISLINYLLRKKIHEKNYSTLITQTNKESII